MSSWCGGRPPRPRVDSVPGRSSEVVMPMRGRTPRYYSAVCGEFCMSTGRNRSARRSPPCRNGSALAEGHVGERDPRLHLGLGGGGPEEDALRERLGEHASFLGWLQGDALADAYASADLFLFASRTDTFGQVLLEAQASALPVVAVAEGGPCSIVEDGVTGRLCPPDGRALAAAVVELAAAPLQRERLAQKALETVRGRTWERALGRLAEGYRRALGERQAAGARRAA